MELKRKGNKIYLDECWYMVPDGNGEFDVFDDGEWEGKYCGSLQRLEEMTREEALDYVLAGL